VPFAAGRGWRPFERRDAKLVPGNPTRFYRTRHPLRVVGEILDWEPHSPEVLQAVENRLAELKRLGVEAIND
jgi:hypothetical protein